MMEGGEKVNMTAENKQLDYVAKEYDSIMKESYVAEDEKGHKYFVPKKDVKIEKKDYAARALAAVAFVTGVGGCVYQAVNSAVVARQQREDLVKDCGVMNILGQQLMFPVLDTNECLSVRDQLGKMQNKIPTNTPMPLLVMTPTGVVTATQGVK